jgi:O-antigen/teichoic acid export membrane protein
MFKSIAVVAGSYVLSIILVLCSDPLLTLLFPGDFVRGHIPSNNALIASTACFVVVSILCAWLCARFAPRKAAKHVLWFLIIGEAMGLAATIPNWSTGWPHWYWLSWLLSWPVSCWLGLMIAGRKADSPAA